MGNRTAAGDELVGIKPNSTEIKTQFYLSVWST